MRFGWLHIAAAVAVSSVLTAILSGTQAVVARGFLVGAGFVVVVATVEAGRRIFGVRARHAHSAVPASVFTPEEIAAMWDRGDLPVGVMPPADPFLEEGRR